MAGFCTKCGKPLPESGVCSCAQESAAPQQPTYQQAPYQQPTYQQAPYQQPTYQQPPYQQPYPGYGQPVRPVNQGPSAFANFFKVFTGYFKDPVGTTRTALEKKDLASGGIVMIASILFVLLGTLFFSLVQHPFWLSFGDLVPAWIVLGIFGAPLAYGVTFGLVFLIAKMSKIQLDPKGVLAAVGVGSILPTCLLAVSMLLGMAHAVIFEILAILMFAAWAVNVFTLIFQVLNIKLNIISTALLIVGLAVAYIVIIMLLNWFVFDGNMVFFIGSSGYFG